MICTVVFEVQPPSPFGLPDGSKIVLPAGRNLITFEATLGPGGGVKTTPSKYREENTAIDMNLNLRTMKGLLKDNVLSLTLEARDARQAYDLATRAAHGIVRHLSLGRGELFSLKPISIANGGGPRPPIFQISIPLGTYAPYDLELVRKDVAAGELVVRTEESLIARALIYYEHGLHLYETLQQAEAGAEGVPDHLDLLATHFALNFADCLLNWWKAITTILGDPAIGRERKYYQTRYAELGLSQQFFRSRIETLRRLRNDADVAHYSLVRQGLEKVQSAIKTTKETVETVLRAYSSFVQEGRSFSRADGELA